MKKAVYMILLLLLVNLPIQSFAGESDLHIEFMNVGKADAILIRQAEFTVVIDTGKNGNGKQIAARLRELGCDHIDIMVITHFDKDHVGGADKVIKVFPVSEILIPDYDSSSKQYQQFLKAVEKAGLRMERLHENRSFSLGKLDFTIDVANESEYGDDEENDFSLVISMSFGETSFLFTGDVERPRIAELLMEGIGHHDVLKVPHHGRREKNSAVFFDAISPRYAVITSDEENLEDASVLKALDTVGAEVFLTRKGTVICESDGNTIRMSQMSD